MTTIWIAIAAVAAVCATIKSLGPAVIGDRPLPAWSTNVIALLAPALLAGLVVSDLAGERWRDANAPVAAGLAAALLVRSSRAPSILAVVVAILVTAATRLLVG